ncbi:MULTISPECIES: TVP38/TMEM64 family protein [unclassified Brevundimonas]|uniref:TVP38/TMEM64 family protein n=1 Tax=unclassified Brevundimonas TaxID=2622653 RepID=UPI000E9BBDEE|nr:MULTISPECIES: VTT domain-containing protein [unclassified Brevundimonas]MCK6103263.1 VTT domain-containing protein [Brevundimonas sp. EYE_349]HBI20431.1 TVP38/TMEM64 family protein [Brevundimonas sp.]
MRWIIDFLSNMEARRWRAVLATALLLGAMIALFAVGKSQLGLDAEEQLEAWLAGFRHGPWGLVAAVVVFTVSAFFGAPQFILIAACVVAFGPWFGFLYSWIATVVSAGVTYWLGRGPTARLLERHGGKTVGRLTRFVGKNAFYASFMIRNVPSAPFIVVNMAFGAARASFMGFLAGCALGVLPKTALVAFFGGSFMTAVSGDGIWTSAILAGVALAWLALMLVVRELVKRREAARGD